MKINPLTGALRFMDLVQGKKDDPTRQQRQKNDHPKKDDQAGEEKDQEASPEELQAAVTAFQGDTQTQAHGLQATVVQQGPGLKVVLKDGGGAVVRQFTGEEFMRLREAASQDVKVRGKILDQKL